MELGVGDWERGARIGELGEGGLGEGGLEWVLGEGG